MTYGYVDLSVFQETGDMCEETLHIGEVPNIRKSVIYIL